MERHDEVIDRGRRDHVCDRDRLFRGWALLGRRQSRDHRCEIVTSNSVVIGDIWFEDGPYKSLDDAKLARSSIRACPKDDRSAD
jgi:hypothetical protein